MASSSEDRVIGFFEESKVNKALNLKYYEPCIFTILDKVRKANYDAFVPQVAGVGVYSIVGFMEEDIVAYCVGCAALRMKTKNQRPLSSSSVAQRVDERDLQLLIQIMQDSDAQGISVRAHYDATAYACAVKNSFGCCSLRDDAVLYKFIVDGCFVIERIIAIAPRFSSFIPFTDNIELQNRHYAFSNTQISYVKSISQVIDFIKLECQLPVKLLINLMKLQGFTKLQFCALFSIMFYILWPFEDIHMQARAKAVFDCTTPPRHLLEWLRNLMADHIQIGKAKSSRRSRLARSIPSAEFLKKAGIEIRLGDVIEVRECCFGLNVILTLPKLIIKEHTGQVFLNMLAFESHPVARDQRVTMYLTLMENIINTKEDVAILRHAGVIDGIFGCDENIADIFNSFCDYTTCFSYGGGLETLVDRVREIYENRGRTTIIEFCGKYVLKPWLVVGMFVGIVMLVLSFLQTIYTIKAYYYH